MRSTKKRTSFTKEDANRKPSMLFTQLGLVLALLLVYIVIESKTVVQASDFGEYIPAKEDIGAIIPDTTPEEPKQEKQQKKVEPEPILENPDIIKDDDPNLVETVIDVQKLDPNTKVDISSFDVPELTIPEDDPEDVPFKDIKNAPLFPGCKGTDEEKKQCFSDSVRKLVSRKFNGDLAQELGLSPGRKRIAVEFVVDKKGEIADVKVRGPHKSLENEARRVVKLLPKMSPGKQRGRPVGVRFMLPIAFVVE